MLDGPLRVGYAVMRDLPEWAQIDPIEIREENRNQGNMSRFVNYLEGVARSWGKTSIIARNINDPILPRWEHLGYVNVIPGVQELSRWKQL
ncbi:MAG TPA: hypothetical protein VNE86_07815 [Nitrososphaerales archaeon]|nr:hypothetical protein [Nitrososphaerales archaeon]